MSDVSTSSVDLLLDAFRRHVKHQRRAVAGTSLAHECTCTCAADTSARLGRRAGLSATDLRRSWLAHWQQVPVWTWNTYAIEDTDHRCTEACMNDVVSRL